MIKCYRDFVDNLGLWKLPPLKAFRYSLIPISTAILNRKERKKLNFVRLLMPSEIPILQSSVFIFIYWKETPL